MASQYFPSSEPLSPPDTQFRRRWPCKRSFVCSRKVHMLVCPSCAPLNQRHVLRSPFLSSSSLHTPTRPPTPPTPPEKMRGISEKLPSKPRAHSIVDIQKRISQSIPSSRMHSPALISLPSQRRFHVNCSFWVTHRVVCVLMFDRQIRARFPPLCFVRRMTSYLCDLL